MLANALRAGLLGPALLALAACQSAAPETAAAGGLDGPGLAGTVRLAVADGLADVAHEQAGRFERQYPAAAIVTQPTTAREALAALQAGTTDAALLDRSPTDAERAALKAAGRGATETLLGADAVVAVVPSASPLKDVSLDDLRRAASGSGPFRLVLASRNVGATVAALEALGVDQTLGTLHQPTEADVVAYVAAHPGTVGLVSAGAAGQAVRVLTVEGVRPTARAVFEGAYPLVQPAVLLTVPGALESRALAAGFARFAAGAQGQEAVLRAGLAPATLPQREVVLL